MKKFFALIITLVWTLPAFAQSPEEIISRMGEVWDKHENEGLVMTIDTKMPVIGTISMKTYSLGDKMRAEAKVAGIEVITWDDGVTEWVYTAKTNMLEIKDSPVGSSSEKDSDAELFTDVTDGYDISIKEEKAGSWLLLCKKSKDNKEKDAPKTIEIGVAKKTLHLLSLKTKMSGITLIMRDISFGVKEEFVTFRMEDYPNAKIEDKRDKTKK